MRASRVIGFLLKLEFIYVRREKIKTICQLRIVSVCAKALTQ